MPTLRILAVLAALVSALVTAPAAAQAPPRVPVEVDERWAAAADAVVTANVGAPTVVDADGVPHRLFPLAVDSVERGEVADPAVVAIAGGELPDGTVVSVSHTAELEAGSTVQLALIEAPPSLQAASPDTVYVISGAEHGVADPAGGAADQGLLSGTGQGASDYRLNGLQWPSFSPTPVFRVNPTGSGVAAGDTINAVRRAANAWENDALSAIDFHYGGQTTLRGPNLGDGSNTVSFQNRPADGWLAQAYWMFNGSTVEFDIVFNTRYNLGDRSGSGQWFDIETTALHEFGHILGLGHVGASSEVMHDVVIARTTKPLGAGDRNGVRVLYPNAEAAFTAPDPGSTLPCNSVQARWSMNAGGTWHVRAGSTPRGLQYFAKSSSTGAVTVTGLPNDGSTVFLSLWHKPTGGAWTVIDESSHLACGQAGFTAPARGSKLPCGSVQVRWAGSSSGTWHVRAGATPKGLQYFAGSSAGGSAITVTGLPSNGSIVHMSLWHLPPGGSWRVIDEATFRSCGIISPSRGTTLPCGPIPLTWGGAPNGVWHVRAGSTKRGLQYFAGNSATGSSITVTGVPQNGSIIHVSLWHLPPGASWRVVDEVTYRTCG